MMVGRTEFRFSEIKIIVEEGGGSSRVFKKALEASSRT